MERQRDTVTTEKASKRVKLSQEIPDEIEDEISPIIHTHDTLSSVGDYLSAMTGTPQAQVSILIDTQIKGKPLQLVNMIQKPTALKKSKAKIPFLPKSKRPKSWSVKQLPIEFQKFQIYRPLNQLWLEYMDQLLGASNQNEDLILTKLTKADYHGALLTVHKSKSKSMTGITGIVLYESAHMFSLVCMDDKVRCVPKLDCIFSISWHGKTFRLYGNHLLISPSERATKKLKPKNTIELV